ncbi:hypothetical protein EI94DRAFT_446588 [Lactarius quietus]|nr:hypothetical protein EI94DRAFT_446588 [Lactarius quietus]
MGSAISRVKVLRRRGRRYSIDESTNDPANAVAPVRGGAACVHDHRRRWPGVPHAFARKLQCPQPQYQVQDLVPCFVPRELGSTKASRKHWALYKKIPSLQKTRRTTAQTFRSLAVLKLADNENDSPTLRCRIQSSFEMAFLSQFTQPILLASWSYGLLVWVRRFQIPPRIPPLLP